MSQAEKKAVVSKRSGRQFVDDGMENHAPADLDPHIDRQSIRSSTTQSSSTSTQTSLEPSPLVRPADGQQQPHDIPLDPLFLGVGGRRRSDQDVGRDAFHPPPTPQQLATSMAETERGLPTAGRPVNFGVVVPGVYRSSFPRAEDYEFIADLKLKTIVTLVQKDFPKGYDEFLRRNGIRHAVFDMKGTKKESIPISTMKSILRVVLDRRNHPLLIHCNHGKHRTGCVIGIVRKLSGWHIRNIIDEYRAFAEPKVRDCDIDYIEAFELANISSLFREIGTNPLSAAGQGSSALIPSLLPSPFRGNPFSSRNPAFFRATAFALVLLVTWLVSGYMLSKERRGWVPDVAPEELLNSPSVD